MWSERFVEYFGIERHWAVRWLKPGCEESACEQVESYAGQPAGFVKFNDRIDAARLYNRLILEHPRWRIEVFSSQTKWLRAQANHDDVGSFHINPAGISKRCAEGAHSACPETASDCACLCHTKGPSDS